MKYHVLVTRDGDGCMADVPALPGTHTWAKTLRALDRNVREVIGMVEDLPRSAEAALDLEMDYHTGDPVLDERADGLRARRREQERAAAEIASDTSELLGQRRLRRAAFCRRCGGAAGRFRCGRISQLRAFPPGPRAEPPRTAGTPRVRSSWPRPVRHRTAGQRADQATDSLAVVTYRSELGTDTTARTEPPNSGHVHATLDVV